jgi:hypothetical protein
VDGPYRTLTFYTVHGRRGSAQAQEKSVFYFFSLTCCYMSFLKFSLTRGGDTTGRERPWWPGAIPPKGGECFLYSKAGQKKDRFSLSSVFRDGLFITYWAPCSLSSPRPLAFWVSRRTLTSSELE